jgi:3-hydroxyisobutyrate dehydrogenase-like beta-hydroxyacid dehydrogenase
MTQRPTTICFIGFGEAGSTLAGDIGSDPSRRLAAYDVKTEDAATRGAMLARYQRAGVAGGETLAEAMRGADLVISLVTADRALDAATAAAAHIVPGALYVDGNSCAPDTKRAAAARIDAAGGAYVDMAIMAPIAPKGRLTPALLAGAQAARAQAALTALGMVPAVAGATVGDASAIKMARSVMIKGFEALTAECLLAARRAGVEEAVLASLEASDPEVNWRAKASYNLERMVVHGVRRAAEMREVAKTVAALGLPPRMAQAIADWQEDIGRLGLDGARDGVGPQADRILAALPPLAE